MGYLKTGDGGPPHDPPLRRVVAMLLVLSRTFVTRPHLKMVQET